MKKIIITSLSFLTFNCVYSQNEKIEIEIRQIEEKRIGAILKKDTVALSKIWATDYFANRPAGLISPREKVLELILKDTLSLVSYESVLEQMIIKNNYVITMGSEIVLPSGNNPNAGKILNRRFTHIWSKENGNWRLTARHANLMCH